MSDLATIRAKCEFLYGRGWSHDRLQTLWTREGGPAGVKFEEALALENYEELVGRGSNPRAAD